MAGPARVHRRPGRPSIMYIFNAGIIQVMSGNYKAGVSKVNRRWNGWASVRV